MNHARRIAAALSLAVALAFALVAIASVASCGATLGVKFDPETGTHTLLLWWDPDSGRCHPTPEPGTVPIEVDLPGPDALPQEVAAGGPLQARPRR